MQVPVYDIGGEITRHIEISDDVFAVPFNESVVHQALVRQLANSRQGTSNTKTRGEVAGSSRKLHRQKHTGYARVGDKKSPLRRGGGIAFGPSPRSYRQAMPKKMRQLALRCVLSAKAADGELMVLEELNIEQPKTKEIVQILKKLGVDSSALIVTREPEDNLIKSARILESIKTMPTNLLNIGDLLSYKMLLMTESAAHRAEELWGKTVPQGEADASV